MSIMMYMLRHMTNVTVVPKPTHITEIQLISYLSDEKSISPRMQEFKKKLKEKPPFTKIEQVDTGMEKDPLPPWPENTNPHTGEVGGPRGPEPTRYGDWERKGRVSDF